MLEDLIKEFFKNPIGLGLIGLTLFIVVPGIRVYIAIIGVIVFITSLGKNGLFLYFAYSSLSALLSFIMLLFNETTPIYQQLYISISYLTFASIGSIIDLIFYVESSGWNWFENLLAAILFGLLTFGSYKLFE